LSTLLPVEMYTLALYNYVEILAFVVSLVTYQRIRSSALRTFPFFLLFMVFIELTARYIRLVLGETNVWLYNISTTIEFVFYGWFFLQVFTRKQNRALASAFIIVYPLIVLLNLIFLQGFLHFHSYTMILGSSVMIIFCCLFLWEKLNNPERIEILTDPLFWICTGILFFYLGDFFYNVFYNFLVTQGMDTGRRLFKAINNNLIIVLYSCFIIAFICSRNSRT
jgi:hypothetical protein